MRQMSNMSEQRNTIEIVLDGFLFPTFPELFDGINELLGNEATEALEPSPENIGWILKQNTVDNILITWENADLSRQAFGYDMTARYYENIPGAEKKAENARMHIGKTIFDRVIAVMEKKDAGYECEVVLVDGRRLDEYTFDPHALSDIYDVELISEDNYAEVLELYQNNQEYFDLLGTVPTMETVMKDAAKCPPKADPAKKYYVLFKDPELVGVADIYLGYPRQDAVWIDLFMIRKDLQGWSYGSEILRDMLDVFTGCGFVWAEAGFVKGNAKAQKFWKRNWFVDLHQETEENGIVYHHMIRGLQ